MQETTVTTKPQYPSLLMRIQSMFIDIIVMIGLMFAASAVLGKFNNVPDWVSIMIFVLVWIAYEPVFTSLGATPGNYLRGLRVRQADNINKRIPLPLAIVRYTVKLLLGWISFLTINSNPQKRAIHDFVAGSVVIEAQ